MHDLVFGTRWNHARLRRLGAILEPHHRFDLGTELPLIKLDGLLATSVEEQIGLNLHDILLCAALHPDGILRDPTPGPVDTSNGTCRLRQSGRFFLDVGGSAQGKWAIRGQSGSRPY